MEEIKKSKVEGFAASCPTCFHNLYSTAPYEIKGVFDVHEILGYAMGIFEKVEDLTGFLE